MLILFIAGLVICDCAETANPRWLADLAVTGGNMEGKETRFGIGGSVLAGVVTSNGATGSYNSMHGSFQPIGVLVLLINMLVGELVFGGLGTGLYSLLMIALVAVFLGGLMVGRSPEYVGKTIGQSEAKLVAFYTVITPLVVLPLAGWAVASTEGRAGLVTNDGVRGFTEIVFAYASCMANNGQNMAGLNANSVYYNTTTIVAMLAGRFVLAALALELAGRFARQGRKVETTGTLPSDTLTFGFLVLGTILLIGALSFLPVLALGPVAEYLKSAAGI
jgi:K+-transporting ATPase ATPase A chain